HLGYQDHARATCRHLFNGLGPYTSSEVSSFVEGGLRATDLDEAKKPPHRSSVSFRPRTSQRTACVLSTWFRNDAWCYSSGQHRALGRRRSTAPRQPIEVGHRPIADLLHPGVESTE